MAVNHVGGGLTIGRRDAFVKLKAWPRIGVLVNQLRCVLLFSLPFLRGRLHCARRPSPALRSRLSVDPRPDRRLLDFQMKRCVDEGTVLEMGRDNPVMRAVLALLQNDGVTASQ